MKQIDLITATQQQVKKLIPEKQIQVVMANIVYFILGVFISKGTVFGMCAPFGVAFLSAVPYGKLFPGFIGTLIGYILPSEINIGIRYISTAIAVYAIRWTLNDLPRIKMHKLYIPILAFTATIATGIAINLANISDWGEVAMYITEAILSAGSAYFFGKAAKIFLSRQAKMKQAELVYLCLSIFIVILSLSKVTIGYISVGQVLSILVILFCAKYLGIVGGSIAGTAAGVVLGLSASSPSYIVGAYAFGGLISGLAASFGRFACCISFLVITLVISVQAASAEAMISGVYEVLLASLIFLLLNDQIGEKFTNLFFSQNIIQSHNEEKERFASKLESTSKALLGISESVNIVSEKLALFEENSLDEICAKSISRVCDNCGLKTFCFDVKSNETADSMANLSTKLKENGKIFLEDFPISFSNRCNRLNALVDNINTLYRESLDRKMAQEQVAQVRSFVSEQFFDIGLLLSDVAAEAKKDEIFDSELAKRVSIELQNLGLIPMEVTCMINTLGRVCIEIETYHLEKSDVQRLSLPRRLSKLCGKKLSQPSITQVADRLKIKLTERPIFDVQVGVAQHICNGGTLCGDNYTYFYDGSGKFIFLLSDGMGTGGRAAVEGAMTCKVMESLIKAEINFQTAIKITNSALMVKSEDEFLTTVDMFSADLFTGNINLMKAGAPLTFLRKNDKVVRYFQSSLPIGILKDVSIASCDNILTSDDRVLMFSDGALSQGDKWLADELAGWTCEDSQAFAEYLLDKAKKSKRFDDDITIVSMKMLAR